MGSSIGFENQAAAIRPDSKGRRAAGILSLRPPLDEAALNDLESETIRLFEALSASQASGDWRPSPVMEPHILVRGALIRTPGVLRRFRRSFLVEGRANFPDTPLPRNEFLRWGERLPSRQQRLSGALRLIKMALQLRRRAPVRFSDLHDPLVGQPSVYRVPGSMADWVRWVLRKLPGPQRPISPSLVAVTEAQIRHCYYRWRIAKAFGTRLGTVVEIGGGYGGLGAELLRNLHTSGYWLVELPDTLPISYFYLRGCFEAKIQVLFRPEDRLDPEAPIVLVAPWKLPEIDERIDLLVNTMSFQHMDRQNLRFYFGQADRLGVRRMYLVNRNTVRDPSDVIIDHYPIPPRLRLLQEIPHPFSEAAHLERLYEAASAID